ncbi:hypothetical protein [Butyrivibrio sp. MC2013]|uniref:hypothetical protein n=1 Tax=Butyrivibrio sp. MC2013 TaxID=1280686 RepID=UPI000427807B|nr:hypothetical protein [Butyrivibrio sp. MC2013]
MANVNMSGVYNHFLTSYAPKDITKADSHKKDELKDIYKSIVRINKDSPLYLQSQDEALEESAITLKEAARRFQAQLTELKGAGENDFGSKIAYTSDEEAVKVTYIGPHDQDAPSFTMEIDNIAVPQVNTGSYMTDSKTSLEAGSYYFDARIGNQNYEFQFTIGAGDSNRSIQNRIAGLINKAGVSLSAEIIEGDNDTAAIKISSDLVGSPDNNNKIFELKDALTSPRHGIVPYFGLDLTSQYPLDASFSVNGEQHHSSSNHFTVGSVYDIEIQAASDAPIFIGTKSDGDTIIDNVARLARSYNHFLDEVSTIGGGSFSHEKVGNAIKSFSGPIRSSLEDIGISKSEDGRIVFDDSKLRAMGSEEEREEKIQPIKDLTDSFYEMTKDIMLDPMKFTDRPIVNYKNPGHGYNNPYITSEYSGMMFNNYC